MCCGNDDRKKTIDEIKVVGYSRIRNEELILQETLDHWGQFCDSIYIYNDASTDKTEDIALLHPKVEGVHTNKEWNPGVEKNGTQRGYAYQMACEFESPDENTWFCNFDADERFIFRSDFREFLKWCTQQGFSGITSMLFDHYITKEDVDRKYEGDLLKLREYVGPEYRKQLFFFRYHPNINYRTKVAREPNGVDISKLICAGYVRHFGKAISVEHFDETCDYYSTYFPEPFRSKWSARKGKAVHTQSDFGNKLYKWEKVETGKVRNIGPILYEYRG